MSEFLWFQNLKNRVIEEPSGQIEFSLSYPPMRE